MQIGNIPLYKLEEIKFPPLPYISQIKFWLTAPDNSFADDGIEEGDLLGIWWPDEADYHQDQPNDIYITYRQYDIPTIRLAKYDFTLDGDRAKVIYDSQEKETEIINLNEPLIIHDVGLVKCVLKNKAF